MSSSVPPVPAAPRATRRDWIGLAVLALPCFLVAMDMTVLNLAIPLLSADLHPTGTQLLWIVDIYGFLIAGSLMTMGTLGDRIGRRRLLLVGATAFGLASTAAAFARSAEMLIAMRGLLGVAGATLAPSTLSLIRNMFLDERQRTVAITVWMTSFSVGGAIGPLVGGVLLEHFWWGSVFLTNVPVMVLLLVLGPMLLPEFKDPAAGNLDLRSAGLSLGAVLALIYGLKRFAESGADALTATAVLGGLLLGFVFVERQRRLPYPFLDLALFRRREFGAALTMNLLVIVALFGLFFLVSQYLQLVLGLSPLRAGLTFVPASIAFIAGSVFVPALSRRFRPGTLIAAGLLLAAPGLFLMTTLETKSGVAFVVLGTIVYQLALTPVFTLSTAIVVGSAPPERAGAAAAISETSYELGGALGVATLGTLGTFLYRSRLVGAVGPDSPGELTAAAKGTLGAVVAMASRVGDAGTTKLLIAAKQAFVDAVHTIAMIGGGLFVALAVFAAVLLRHATLGEQH